MKHLLSLPALLATLLVTLGITQFLSAQRASAASTSGTQALSAVAITNPNVDAVLRAMGGAGNIIGGPALVEATGPVANRPVFRQAINATLNLAISVYNSGDEPVTILSSGGAFLFSVEPGESQASVSSNGLNNGFAWSCAGSGTCKFTWVVRSF